MIRQLSGGYPVRVVFGSGDSPTMSNGPIQSEAQYEVLGNYPKRGIRPASARDDGNFCS
jgi:hypothetical protein